MNRYKLDAIMRQIRRRGQLPTDRWGGPMSVDDVLVWYGLNGRLTPDEAEVVKMELAALREAEQFEELWRNEETEGRRGD